MHALIIVSVAHVRAIDYPISSAYVHVHVIKILKISPCCKRLSKRSNEIRVDILSLSIENRNEK